MNEQELIISGQLELYVAGALSPREMSNVAAYARSHPGVCKEIQQIEQTLVDWLGEPPFHKPMEKREQDEDVERLLARIHHEATGSVVPINGLRRAHSGTRVLVAAAVVALIIMTGVSVWFGMENLALRNRIRTIAAYQQKIAAENSENQGRFASMQEQMAIMRSILTRRVQLTAVSGNKITGKDNYLLIYWNPQSKKWILADEDLPGLSRDQQYQLWALYDGKPRSAGVFDAGAGHFVVNGRQDVTQAQAFAVTVEPRGGSEAPTLSNLCMMAKL